MESNNKIPANIKNVIDVPTAGILIKVGTKVPIILPIVFAAFSFPTTLPLPSKLSMENLTREGVTVPRRNRGKTNTIIQVTKPAIIRKLLSTLNINSADIKTIIYFPTTGIAPIHIAAIIILLYNLSGLGSLSATRPPYKFPSAIAIIIVPIIIVQTICEELKYGANSLLAPSSTAITDIPAKNSVMYRYILLFRIFLSKLISLLNYGSHLIS